MEASLLQDAVIAAKAAEEKAAQDEADRQKRIKDSYDAVVPDEIQQKVQAALQMEIVSTKQPLVCDVCMKLRQVVARHNHCSVDCDTAVICWVPVSVVAVHFCTC